MAIKKFRPITPARRFMSVMDTSDITSKPTVRSLLVRVKAQLVEIITVESLLDIKKQVLKNYIELSILKEINLVFRVLYQLLSTTHTETVEFV
tara:strand:+ start:213 stop:491 length:279 start_codon:yes stop_codon:yes gene_type:complete